MKKSVLKKPLIFSLSLALALSGGVAAYAAKHEETKPANGTSQDEPFRRHLANSSSFRIPALITLNSGRIVAAADARWNTCFDGGGLDTIVSYSDDNGKNWNYSFVNYLGDNGNVYNSKSTCFIDPALATDGSKVWMICDIYPYQVALNGARGKIDPSIKETGFDEKGHLLLTADEADDHDESSQYNYYLNLTDLKIYDRATGEIAEEAKEYTVDEHFNIKDKDGEVDTNLFFEDSPYKVQRTSYLYLVSSEDGGKTFSAPKLLPVKNNAEKAYLIGPGRGVYTKKGHIIFPCYSHNGGVEKTSFVYSTDNGETWHRSEDAPTSSTKSSESAVIELPNGNLRFFYRNHQADFKLKYMDAEFSEDTQTYNWKEEVKTDIIINSATQMSAMVYSSPVNNRTTFLLSCPTGPNEQGSNSTSGKPINKGGQRLNGKIFVGFLNDDTDNTIEWLSNPMRVGDYNSEFMYSCLTELKDGNIALLYEDHQENWGNDPINYFTMTYKTYNLSNVIPDAHVGSAALKEQLNKAGTLTEESYTKSSYKALAEAVAKANKAIADKKPKEELDTLAPEVEAAITGLKKRGSVVKANIAIAEAAKKEAEADKYTAISLKALKDAVIRLKAAAIDNSDTDEDTMNGLIKSVEEAIANLVIKSNSGSGSGGNSGGGGYTPSFPSIPSAPSTPSVTQPEEKKTEDTAKKPEETPSEQEIKDTETPQGEAAVKKVFTLPSSKKLISLKSLKGLDKASSKEIKLAQKKSKVDVALTGDALAELVTKKVKSFTIDGKNFTVKLSSKNIKDLSKLKGKKVTLKVNKLKSGKFSIVIRVDGKKLNANQIKNLKINVK